MTKSRGESSQIRRGEKKSHRSPINLTSGSSDSEDEGREVPSFIIIIIVIIVVEAVEMKPSSNNLQARCSSSDTR